MATLKAIPVRTVFGKIKSIFGRRLILKIQIYEAKAIHVKFNGGVSIIPKPQLKTAT